MKKLDYCIFDPTGNITALVETEVPVAEQPAAASAVMAKHPEVEQVGFVRHLPYTQDMPDQPEAPDPASEPSDRSGSPAAELRMAGGEFCGNATMCAAALCAVRKEECRIGTGRKNSGLPDGNQAPATADSDNANKPGTTVMVKASGASEPLEVRLWRTSERSYDSAVTMPPALGVDERIFSVEAADETGSFLSAVLPVVHMEGIDHIMIEESSAFSSLKDSKAAAERAVKKFCAELGSDCLGLMFVSSPECDGCRNESEPSRQEKQTQLQMKAEMRLTPLVYVPGADTIFWESSCASGTTAAGIWLAAKEGRAVDASFVEPAGTLRVQSDPESGRTVLYGSAKLISRHELSLN